MDKVCKADEDLELLVKYGKYSIFYCVVNVFIYSFLFVNLKNIM